MYLESDAFRIDYDPSRVEAEAIMTRIRSLGYKPEAIDDATNTTPVRVRHSEPLPEPVSNAANEAWSTSKLLFLDFYASWCGPCKVLEKRILPDREVQESLREFEFVKVDTDRFPEAAKYFGVVGLPTLVVLDENLNELFRHLGPISAGDLAESLRSCRRDSTGKQN